MTLEDIAKSDPVVNNIAQIIVSIRHKWCRVIYIADLTQWYKAFVVKELLLGSQRQDSWIGSEMGKDINILLYVHFSGCKVVFSNGNHDGNGNLAWQIFARMPFDGQGVAISDGSHHSCRRHGTSNKQQLNHLKNHNVWITVTHFPP